VKFKCEESMRYNISSTYGVLWPYGSPSFLVNIVDQVAEAVTKTLGC
jgi:hypothetical protein